MTERNQKLVLAERDKFNQEVFKASIEPLVFESKFNGKIWGSLGRGGLLDDLNKLQLSLNLEVFDKKKLMSFVQSLKILTERIYETDKTINNYLKRAIK